MASLSNGDWILCANKRQATTDASPPMFELTASQNCLMVLTSSNLLLGLVALNSKPSRDVMALCFQKLKWRKSSSCCQSLTGVEFADVASLTAEEESPANAAEFFQALDLCF